MKRPQHDLRDMFRPRLPLLSGSIAFAFLVLQLIAGCSSPQALDKATPEELNELKELEELERELDEIENPTFANLIKTADDDTCATWRSIK